MSGIATFVLQYAASGALEAPLQEQQLAGLPLLDVLLASTALLHWYSFDRSLQGACGNLGLATQKLVQQVGLCLA